MRLISLSTDSADQNRIYHRNQIKFTQINLTHLMVCVTAKMIVIRLNYRQFREVTEAGILYVLGDTDFFAHFPP